MTNLSKIINFEKYPIDNFESPQGVALLRSINERLSNDGVCVLDDFVTEEALTAMVTEAESLVDSAYQGPTEATPYFFNYDIGEGLEEDQSHPVNRKGKRNLKQVATDLIPTDHLLNKLYRSELMLNFIGQVLGAEAYCIEDKYQSLNISIMDEGGCQQWHFDNSPMVITLLLQQPQGGGVFECAPNIRSESNENFDDVRRVLDGESDRVQQIDLKRGCLSLFRGHYSLHRVTEVTGHDQRLQAILGYTMNPDHAGNIESSILHYGPRIATVESTML